MKQQKNDLEELIRLSHVVAKPYRVAFWGLLLFLLISMYANYKLATRENVITVDADADNQSFVEQNVKR